jgi:uncharacterized membrane protein (UPF0127 family)
VIASRDALARARSTRRARPPRRRLLAIVAIVLACLACEGTPGESASTGPEPDAWMTINGTRVALELALTPSEQRLGLGDRDSLAWNHGMLFLYDAAGFPGFWMRGMRFDIDIVWIRGDRIVDISHGVRHVPGGNGPTVRPRELTDKVLEVPAGFATAHGWRIGQPAELEQSSEALQP